MKIALCCDMTYDVTKNVSRPWCTNSGHPVVVVKDGRTFDQEPLPRQVAVGTHTIQFV